MHRDFFENLFVLEMTNNHLGNVARGLDIIRQHSRVVRFNGVRAAIKLQFRDVDTFIHRDFKERTDVKYVNRVRDTKLSKSDYGTLCAAIRDSGCLPLATPFDETSVGWCVEFGMKAIKVASADANDWVLLNRIAETKLPVIVSLGGAPLKDMDDLVTFFERRGIPLALNHCVAAYPHSSAECELHQIDFLRDRYPNHVIGWSTHERGDSADSVAIAYAKGARTFEKHIDSGTGTIADYSATPDEIDRWFQAHSRAVCFCGTARTERRVPLLRETAYLDSYVRGVYAKRVLFPGQILTKDDFYMAIPLMRGQLSCRELMLGDAGHRLTVGIEKDAPITADKVDVPKALAAQLAGRGL